MSSSRTEAVDCDKDSPKRLSLSCSSEDVLL